MTAEGRIVLVSMPFGQVFSPSIALSLLKSELAAHDMSAEVKYFSIQFAELIGQHFYYGLSAESRPSIEHLAGEWIFSGALPSASRPARYVDAILRKRGAAHTGQPVSAALIRRILRARAQVDGFLRECLDWMLRARPRLVGFTSMFQQHAASLALARLIKQALPESFVVFGGANCADVMGAETVRQFPFVDAVVSGEADLVFPELARRVLEGQPVGGLPGVRTPDGVAAEFARGRFSPAPMVRDMDALPYPDYSDYFEQFEASRFAREWQPSIYLETSRGCWWGERMHCTFCGLNGQTMAFRAKSAPRAVEELTTMTGRYPACVVEMTDNILDLGYFKEFVPELARRPPATGIFYEVKANLRKDQLRSLRDAGIRSIQPGIESFSDPVLKLMRKGVSALQNVQLLKWCKELGLQPGWNVLWGFPGEPPDEYLRMARLVPLLTHLQPPEGYGMIRLDRFSPNFFDSERLGFADVRPLPAYRHVYSLSEEALGNLAYYFDFGYREPRDVRAYAEPLFKALREWRQVHEKNDLFSVDLVDGLLVWDLRPAGRTPLTILRGADRFLYRACDAAIDVRRLVDCLDHSIEDPASGDVIERRLESLVESRLMVRDGTRYLALAVPLGEYSPPAPVVARFHELVRALGRAVPDGWLVPADIIGETAERHARPATKPRRGGSRSRTPRMPDDRLDESQFSIDERGGVLVRRRAARHGGSDAWRQGRWKNEKTEGIG